MTQYDFLLQNLNPPLIFSHCLLCSALNSRLQTQKRVSETVVKGSRITRRVLPYLTRCDFNFSTYLVLQDEFFGWQSYRSSVWQGIHRTLPPCVAHRLPSVVFHPVKPSCGCVYNDVTILKPCNVNSVIPWAHHYALEGSWWAKWNYDIILLIQKIQWQLCIVFIFIVSWKNVNT